MVEVKKVKLEFFPRLIDHVGGSYELNGDYDSVSAWRSRGAEKWSPNLEWNLLEKTDFMTYCRSKGQWYVQYVYRHAGTSSESALPLTMKHHSTGCCGARTLYFSGYEWGGDYGTNLKTGTYILYEVMRMLLKVVSSSYRSEEQGMMFDCIVTNKQKNLKKVLEETFGFKCINSFVNMNSNNTCYHMALNMTKTYKLPDLVD